MYPGVHKEEGEEWRSAALCAQTDPEAFFPEKGGNAAIAKRMCALCGVREECLAHALARNERFGVWGGLSANERDRLLGSGPEKPRTPVQTTKDLRDERIRTLADDNVGVPTIAAEAGVTERTVHRVLRKHRQTREAAVPA